MNYCFRCGMTVPMGDVHIVWGDEERRKAIEKMVGRSTSLCLRPVNKTPQPVLCTCKGYIFDFFDVPCPLCGAIYVGGVGRP